MTGSHPIGLSPTWLSKVRSSGQSATNTLKQRATAADESKPSHGAQGPLRLTRLFLTMQSLCIPAEPLCRSPQTLGIPHVHGHVFGLPLFLLSTHPLTLLRLCRVFLINPSSGLTSPLDSHPPFPAHSRDLHQLIVSLVSLSLGVPSSLCSSWLRALLSLVWSSGTQVTCSAHSLTPEPGTCSLLPPKLLTPPLLKAFPF